MTIHPALRVTYGPAAEDALVALLWQSGTTGIEFLSGALLAFFTVTPPTTLTGQLLELGASAVEVEQHEAFDWVLASRDFAKDHHIGPLVVCPPWSEAVSVSDRRRIVIEPAAAFGTGSHESTRLVLAELVAEPPTGLTLLDVGTGSGILAIAGCILGARCAIGIDLDIDAIGVAQRHVGMNLVADCCLLAAGGPQSIRGQFPLVLANLTLEILSTSWSDVAARVAPGGELVTSGYLVADAARLEALCEPEFEVRRRRQDGEWVAHRLRRLEPAR